MAAPPSVRIVTTLDEVAVAVAEIRAAVTSGAPCANWLGFDMEWVPEKRTGKAKDIVIVTQADDFTTKQVALVQISTASTAYLFRMCAFVAQPPSDDPLLPCACPPDLAELLTDTSIYFAGVGIDGDRVRFFSDFGGVWAANAVDVAEMFARSTKCLAHPSADAAAAALVRDAADDATCRSLSDYSSRALGVTMGKDLTVTCSNWCSRQLMTEQIQYAAADAWVSLLLLFRAAEYLGIDGTQPDALQPFALTTQPRGSTTRCAKPASAASSQPQPARKPVMGYEGRKQPYYGNIKVLACDDPNRVLFTVSITKADWYIKENLADLVDPGTTNADGSISGRVIRLRFSPNLDREEDSELRPDASFFAAEKANCCVVCGGNPPGGMVRFFVIPMAYRKHFPREFVSHNSFDIVLVCVDCMKTVNLVYDAERRKLSQEYQFPIGWVSAKVMADALTASDAPPALGATVAEHNRIIVRMTKDATALIFALIAEEKKHLSIPLTGSAKDNAVLPPHRWDALFLQLHSTNHQYEFPDALPSTDTDSNGTNSDAAWQEKYWQEIQTALKRRHARLHNGAELSDAEALRMALDDSIQLHGARAPKKGDNEADEADLPHPPTSVALTWRQVYAMMRAERWKVKLRPAAPAAVDSSEDSGATTDAEISTNHFQYVVQEIIRRAMVAADGDERGIAEWKRALADSEAAAAKGNGSKGNAVLTPRPALEGVCAFIYRWRCLFLSKVKPRYMPTGWYPEQGLIGVKPPAAGGDATAPAAPPAAAASAP